MVRDKAGLIELEGANLPSVAAKAHAAGGWGGNP